MFKILGIGLLATWNWVSDSDMKLVALNENVLNRFFQKSLLYRTIYLLK